MDPSAPMDDRSLFLIGDRPGCTPQVGRLIAMMSYARHTTLADVDGLGEQELDYRHDERSNTIGALLWHIAAVEFWYQASTFEGRELDAAEMREWGAALDLGEPARLQIRGHGLGFYRGNLERVRATTFAELARRDDAWLEEQAPFWNGQPANNHFKWFHVLEDELSYRGQIRWLRKRATTTRS